MMALFKLFSKDKFELYGIDPSAKKFQKIMTKR